MSRVPCMYSKLIGECSDISSVLFPDLCTGHVSQVFGLGQLFSFLPSGVSRSISKLSTNISFGITLIADWPDLGLCDDVVFNENDTVIAFSEYKKLALVSNCDTNNEGYFNDDIAEQLQQRQFSRALAEARFAAICASNFSRNTEKRNLFSTIAAAQFLSAKSLSAKSKKFSDEQFLSKDALFVISSNFRLSKPLNAYYRKVRAIGNSGEYEPMVWDTYRNATRGTGQMYSTIGIGEIEFFRHHNAINMVSGEFDSVACSTSDEIQLNVIAEKMTAVARELHLHNKPKFTQLRRTLRRPLLNQYDDSILGDCHKFFMPTFPELYNARVLSVICSLSLPISTITRPSGTVTEEDYLMFYSDKMLYDKDDTSYGIGKVSKTKVFSTAFATLDNEQPRDADATEYNTDELSEFTRKLLDVDTASEVNDLDLSFQEEAVEVEVSHEPPNERPQPQLLRSSTNLNKRRKLTE